MTSLAAAKTYFDAWNRHDADGILASMTPDGLYIDPTVPKGVSGQGIVEMVSSLWGAFPDLQFELVSVDAVGEDRVVAQWVMVGSNLGSLNGLPPTQKSVRVIGSDFIDIAEGRVKRVQGYFDSGEVPRQLGLQIIVQPEQAGPFEFGTSVRVSSGRPSKPGEVVATVIEVETQQEVARVSEMSRAIAIEMLGMQGFIGFCAMILGRRMITISAWESADDARQLMGTKSPMHMQAAKLFYSGDQHNSGAMIWLQPKRFLRSRYDASTGHVVRDGNADGISDMGQPMSDVPIWW